jgi:anthranilate synthase component I
MHYPDFQTFSRLALGVHLVPVYRRLIGDSLTPVSAFHRLDAGSSACLFESVVGGEKVGRYSFLTAEPFLEIEAWGNRVVVRAQSAGKPADTAEFESPNPIEELRNRLDALRAVRLPELPPFVSGAIGYAGYDVVRYSEKLPNAPPDDRQLPDLSFAFYDRMVVFDNITKTIVVVAMARVDTGDLRAAYDDACRRVDKLVEKLSSPSADLPPVDISPIGDSKIAYQSNFTQAAFQQAVEKCVEYIRAGDIFQVVISQRLELAIKSQPFEIYRTLRVVNPSPFMFYLRTPSVTLVGSSPEVMVRVVDGKVTVRPLAGTRRRGGNEDEDRKLAEELLADPKERAEHVMLVDLGRNDVGRVARYGSVELTDVMTIERYSHVMHITSNVTGRLADGKDAFDALRACLPAGTVSGAPKVRAMQIIDELEPHRRGPYAGAIGYVDYSGNMDTCIALRTIVIPETSAQRPRIPPQSPPKPPVLPGDRPAATAPTCSTKTAYLQAGAGIVADSQPEAEWNETLNKARGLLKAIEITEQRMA